MTQSKKIAVTGGIGSGKSVFCEILKEKGFRVFSCDEIYGEILKTEEYLDGLFKLFPDCFEEGKPVKARLAGRVFSDRAAREKLDALAHPRIMAELLARMDGCALSFAEVPLLFEGGYEKLFDEVVVLVRDERTRVAAVAARDKLSAEQVLARMRAQCGAETYKNKKCTVLTNDGTIEELRRKAEQFLRERNL